MCRSQIPVGDYKEWKVLKECHMKTVAHRDILNNDIKVHFPQTQFLLCLNTTDLSVVYTHKSTSSDFTDKYTVGAVYVHLTCRSLVKASVFAFMLIGSSILVTL